MPDIYCKFCGEPWDMYFEAEMTISEYAEAACVSGCIAA